MLQDSITIICVAGTTRMCVARLNMICVTGTTRMCVARLSVICVAGTIGTTFVAEIILLFVLRTIRICIDSILQ